jgi:hypothetical protein
MMLPNVWQARKVEAMDLTGTTCGCGSDVRYAVQLGCLQCDARCCPACVIALEAASYCARCAGSLLETPMVRAPGVFDLQ